MYYRGRYLHCISLCFIFCSEIQALSIPTTFPQDGVGGTCTTINNADDCKQGKIRLTCHIGFCHCEPGYEAHYLLGRIGCYGLSRSFCILNNIDLPPYLYDKVLFDAEHARAKLATQSAPKDVAIEEHFIELELIALAKMEGKSDKDWSCFSGNCGGGKCSKGINSALHALNLPIGTTTQKPKNSKCGGKDLIKLSLVCIGVLTALFGPLVH